jgi:hypothetical protein
MRPAPAERHVVVIGAGGGAGGAALHAALGDAGYDQVTVLTTHRFLRMPPRLADAGVKDDDWAAALPAAGHAVIVFDTVRRARERVYWQPARADLVPLATALHAQGVRTLEVVTADSPDPSPAERQALASLGWDRLDMHPAVVAVPPPAPTGPWLERLALWLIRTLVATLQMAQAAYGRRPPR